MSHTIAQAPNLTKAASSLKTKDVEVSVTMTARQHAALKHYSAAFRMTVPELLLTSACSDVEGWGTFGEAVEGTIPQAVRFVKERKTPKVQGWDSGLLDVKAIRPSYGPPACR